MRGEKKTVFDAVIDGKLPSKAEEQNFYALARVERPDAGPNMERHAVYPQDSIIMLYAAETKRIARRSLLARSLGHRIEKNLEISVIEQPIEIEALQDHKFSSKTHTLRLWTLSCREIMISKAVCDQVRDSNPVATRKF